MKVDKNCIFCKIIAGNLESKLVFESDNFVVFEDINPKAPVHVLVVPRNHIANVNDINEHDQEIMGTVFEVIQTVAKKMSIAEAYQLKVNNGAGAGQVVDHLHIHLLGGWAERQQD